jgi:diguanylate cyclase (GGDEF)-like protein
MSVHFSLMPASNGACLEPACSEAEAAPSIDRVLEWIDAQELWSEIEDKASSDSRVVRLSKPLADICRRLSWNIDRRIAVHCFCGVAFVMWLSMPFDYMVAPHALSVVLLGHGLLTLLALVAALLAWVRIEWQMWQGVTACWFVVSGMIAALMTGFQVGGADCERFVIIGFFGMAASVALLPIGTWWTAAGTLVLNAIFLISQFANPGVDGASGLLFTLYCSLISGALVWARSQINSRQARAILLRLTEARASRLMKHMALTDALTGLYNRKAMTEAFDDIIRHAPAGMALSVAMIDIDDFKRLNDSLGHAAGDQALRAIGAIFSRILVPGRLICGRIGGEEFLILMPKATENAARQTITSLMRELDDMNLSNPGSRVADRVTLSAGVVTVIIRANQSHHPEHLMRHADLALYEAKQTGRSRIVSVAVPAV